MRKLVWKYIKKLENMNAIEEFLNEKKIELPISLIEFLKENNGGRPSEKTFNTDCSKEYVFKALLSYNEDDAENIYTIYASVFENTKFYPIGMDASGNFICYDLTDKQYILLKHETDKVENIIV